jgi:hypothetical protein
MGGLYRCSRPRIGSSCGGMGREPKGPLGFMRIHAHTSKRDAHMGYSHAALIPMNCRKVGAKPRPALWGAQKRRGRLPTPCAIAAIASSNGCLN